jgi:SAM-dependent methyltransferase
MSNMLYKQFNKLFNKCSLCAKILILIALLMLVILVFKGFKQKEGFQQIDRFLFKSGSDIYDDFYAEIYDYLVFNNIKNEYEVGEIVNKTTPTNESKILDIGCGTGHNVALFNSKGLDVIGIDISPSMIKKAKKNYPKYDFKVADALNQEEFTSNSFTHIICMNFTIYYLKDRNKFFQNSMNWLMPGGYLIVHLIDRENIRPILQNNNKNISMKFNNFAYNTDFQLDEQNNIVKVTEKFKDKYSGKVRKNEHIMYMPDTKVIVDEAFDKGFILYSKVDLSNCQYEYQYLYIFTKPN